MYLLYQIPAMKKLGFVIKNTTPFTLAPKNVGVNLTKFVHDLRKTTKT